MAVCALCGNEMLCKGRVCVCNTCRIIHEIKMKAIFLGRFQPFHLGHVHAVKEILKECDMIMIAVGSSQEHGTEKNPFSKYEREEMIKLAMKENSIPKEKYSIIFIPDIIWHDRYVEHVKRHAKFDVFYASEENVTADLFRKAGEKVKVLKRIENISGTQIRDILAKSKNKKDIKILKDMLPLSVLDYLIEEKAGKRLKEIAGL